MAAPLFPLSNGNQVAVSLCLLGPHAGGPEATEVACRVTLKQHGTQLGVHGHQDHTWRHGEEKTWEMSAILRHNMSAVMSYPNLYFHSAASTRALWTWDRLSAEGERKREHCSSAQMSGRRVGFCLSDKKRRRINLFAFAELCASHGVEVVEIDLSQPLESQGPFEVIVHKLSDVIVEAEYDSQSQQLLDNFQGYVSAHPHTVLLDPLPAMSQLLDRFASYRIMSHLQNSLRDWRISSPPYLEISTSDLSVIQEDVESKGLSFPLNAHPPCVLQSFVNHGAVLHKVGEAMVALVRELRAELGMALFGVDAMRECLSSSPPSSVTLSQYWTTGNWKSPRQHVLLLHLPPRLTSEL
ncbi:unnamed protein product [Coregonus sp. 'balchen']|nr:unnamed protein product [Coregonus sp. 'balchen']